MTDEVKQQGNFEGWAIVEMMGHRQEIGYVTTQAFGQAVLFRVDTPELTDREFTLRAPEFVNTSSNERHWAPAGTKVKRAAVPAKSCLVAPSSLYALNPCTEEAARTAIERAFPRPLILIELPANKALGPVEEVGNDYFDPDDEDDDEFEGEEVGSEEETTVSSSDPTASKGSAA